MLNGDMKTFNFNILYTFLVMAGLSTFLIVLWLKIDNSPLKESEKIFLHFIFTVFGYIIVIATLIIFSVLTFNVLDYFGFLPD